MTVHPPTMTHAELTELETSLRRLSQLIFDSPSWGDSTALGILAESDDDTISAAAKIVHRLAMDAKYTRTSDTCYLHVPTLAPVPENCRRCGVVITATGHPRYCAVCDDVLNGGHRVMS